MRAKTKKSVETKLKKLRTGSLKSESRNQK